jgi:diacylglycerol kinase family enzyme
MASHALEKSMSPTCILNGASIHVEAARALIARISGEFGVPANIVVARSGNELSPLAVRALAENGQPVVAGGGDGTINAVAGVLAGTNTALGVLPMGTLNRFAKQCRVNLDVPLPRQ